MTTSHSFRRAVLGAAAIAILPAAAAFAVPVNGIVLKTRVFNDFTTSTLVTTNTNTNPGTVTINESGYVNDNIGGNFANRHDALFSSDNGVTAATFNIANPFIISTTLNLGAVSTATVKEAGLRINSPITGDALFIVKTNGEIAAFGGGAPFKSFASPGAANGYVNGTSIFLAEKYTPSASGGTIEYFVNRTNPAAGFGSGVETSGPLAFSNLELGPVNYSLGAYVQIPPDLAAAAAPDALTASFTNLSATVTPEPTTLASLALGGLLLRRRR